jgi:hypothetical protein
LIYPLLKGVQGGIGSVDQPGVRMRGPVGVIAALTVSRLGGQREGQGARGVLGVPGVLGSRGGPEKGRVGEVGGDLGVVDVLRD